MGSWLTGGSKSFRSYLFGIASNRLRHHYNKQNKRRLEQADHVLSGRIDKHPLIPDISKTISPRLAGIYRVADATSIRATAGRKVRRSSSQEATSTSDRARPSGRPAVATARSSLRYSASS